MRPSRRTLRPCPKLHLDLLHVSLFDSAEFGPRITEGFRSDRKVVIEAVQENAEALLYAAECFQSDKSFILEAVKAKAEALRYAS